MLKLKSKQFVALVGDFLMAGAALFSALTLRFFDIPGNERVMVHVELFAPLFVFLVIYTTVLIFTTFLLFRHVSDSFHALSIYMCLLLLLVLGTFIPQGRTQD